MSEAQVISNDLYPEMNYVRRGVIKGLNAMKGATGRALQEVTGLKNMHYNTLSGMRHYINKLNGALGVTNIKAGRNADGRYSRATEVTINKDLKTAMNPEAISEIVTEHEDGHVLTAGLIKYLNADAAKGRYVNKNWATNVFESIVTYGLHLAEKKLGNHYTE